MTPNDLADKCTPPTLTMSTGDLGTEGVNNTPSVG